MRAQENQQRETMGVVIAVDGPSGAGKSSASRTLARRLGYRYVNTGAMYRAVAFLAGEKNIAARDADRLAELAAGLVFEFKETADGENRVIAGNRDLTVEIRAPVVGQMASAVSTHAGVREHLVRAQRALAAGASLVAEGRDIGTVVFPRAIVKFFITADPVARAERRRKELAARGVVTDRAQVAAQQADRDRRDSSRAQAPLRRADDAIVLDTTLMSLDEVVSTMEGHVAARLGSFPSRGDS